MARIVTGPEITGQVSNAQTGGPLGGVVVTARPAVYTTPELTTSTTSLTTTGDGTFSCYATPGTYTFTAPTPAAPIETVEVLSPDMGAGVIDGGSA
jgi:hypothetical protein